METTEKTTFTPEPIATDWRSYNQALKAWKEYTDAASDLYDWICSFLNRDELRPTDFLSLVSLEPDVLIVELYKIKGGNPKGFELKQLVKLGLITNEFQSETLAALDAYHTARQKAESLFKYDISKVYNKEGFFTIDTDEFKKDLEEHFTTYTRSPLQTEALEQIKKFADVCNWFYTHGITKPRYGRRGLDMLMFSVKTADDRESFEPSPDVFKLKYWREALK